MSNRVIDLLRNDLEEELYVSESQRAAWEAALYILEKERENRFLRKVLKINLED